MRILELAGSGEIGTGQGSSASTVITELSNAFSQLGHTVTLMDTPTSRPRHRLDRRIEVIEVGTEGLFRQAQFKVPRVFSWARHSLLKSKEVLKHWRYLQACAAKADFRRYDIVHTHHGKQAYFLTRRFRTDYAYTSHWAFQPDDNGFDANIERKIVNEALLAIGLGDYLRTFAPNANIRVIPHGLDLNEWQAIDRRAARGALGYTDEDFVLLFVGFIKPHKGVDVLLEAFVKLAPRIKRLKLVALGPLGGSESGGSMGSFARGLVERARGYDIAFPGQVAHRSIEHRTHLAAADLFVLPSRAEAQGLVALEAMAMGTPVVASRVGGLGEMITDDVGWKVPPGDSNALAEAILGLHRNPDLLARLRENCRPHVERKYTWLGVAQRYVTAFESCLARQVPAGAPRALAQPETD